MRWIVALWTLAAAFGGAMLIASAQAQSPSAEADARPGLDNRVVVTAATVTVSSPRDRVRSIGTGRALRAVEVTTEVAGTIEQVHFQANEAIEAGAPLVTLERAAEQIALRSAQADFETQRASFERYESLRRANSSAVSEAQLDQARAAMLVAEANVAAAQYEVDRRVIRAPFEGRVGLSDLEPGGYLSAGAAVVGIYDDTQLLVDFEVPETAAAAIEVGLPLRLITPSLVGRPFTGDVVAFDAVIDRELRALRVRAAVDNDDRLLRPGMTFEVSIAREQEPLPVVPAVSISWGREGAFVWRVTDDDTAERVPLVIRHRTGDRVWIEADLKEGDRVVEDGVLKISSGTPLLVDQTLQQDRRS